MKNNILYKLAKSTSNNDFFYSAFYITIFSLAMFSEPSVRYIINTIRICIISFFLITSGISLFYIKNRDTIFFFIVVLLSFIIYIIRF